MNIHSASSMLGRCLVAALLFYGGGALAQSPYSYRDTPFDYTPPPFDYAPAVPQPPASPSPAPATAAAPGSPAAPAGPPGPAAPFKRNGYVEAGGFYHKVTNNFGDWYGAYAKGSLQTDPKNTWHTEVQAAEQFRDQGLLGTLGNTHLWNEDWYTVVTVGGGASDFYLPRFRADAFIYRKWLENKRLITYAGTGYSEAQEVFNDKHLTLGAIYYWGGPWITEAGVRFNLSDPGSVHSRSHYAAITHHEDKNHTLTLRFSFGNESYQIVGPRTGTLVTVQNPDGTFDLVEVFSTSTQLVDFNSREGYLYYKNWLGDDWGYVSQVDGYHNPFYDRYGLRFGLFKEF